MSLLKHKCRLQASGRGLDRTRNNRAWPNTQSLSPRSQSSSILTILYEKDPACPSTGVTQGPSRKGHETFSPLISCKSKIRSKFPFDSQNLRLSAASICKVMSYAPRPGGLCRVQDETSERQVCVAGNGARWQGSSPSSPALSLVTWAGRQNHQPLVCKAEIMTTAKIAACADYAPGWSPCVQLVACVGSFNPHPPLKQVPGLSSL